MRPTRPAGRGHVRRTAKAVLSLGTTVSDQSLVRYIPLGVLAILVIFFGPTGYWAPWRFLWRLCPALNRWFFPDLNGVWGGSTRSNWPVVERLAAAARSHDTVSETDLNATDLQRDAIAVQITTSLFIVRIKVFATSTSGESHSLAARPWRDQHSERMHITNIYRQVVPVPKPTDESIHLGAADLEFDHEEPGVLRGEYWTRRKWRSGMNTAGNIELIRRSDGRDRSKTLRAYAAEEKARLDNE